MDTSTPSVTLMFQVSIEDAEVLMAIYAVLTGQWSKNGTNSVSLWHLGSHLLYLADQIDTSAPENDDSWLENDFEKQLVARFEWAMHTLPESEEATP